MLLFIVTLSLAAMSHFICGARDSAESTNRGLQKSHGGDMERPQRNCVHQKSGGQKWRGTPAKAQIGILTPSTNGHHPQSRCQLRQQACTKQVASNNLHTSYQQWPSHHLNMQKTSAKCRCMLCTPSASEEDTSEDQNGKCKNAAKVRGG